MKRNLSLFAAFALCMAPTVRAQDAATEERLNKLAGQIEDIKAAQDVFGKRIETLSKDIENLRSALDKPTGNYAAQEDLKKAAAVAPKAEFVARNLTALQNHNTVAQVSVIPKS